MSPEFPGEKILSGRKIAPDPLNVYIDPVQTYNLKKKTFDLISEIYTDIQYI